MFKKTMKTETYKQCYCFYDIDSIFVILCCKTTDLKGLENIYCSAVKLANSIFLYFLVYQFSSKTDV